MKYPAMIALTWMLGLGALLWLPIADFVDAVRNRPMVVFSDRHGRWVAARSQHRIEP